MNTPKFNRLADIDNIKLIDELCLWIDNNLDTVLGLNELVKKSDLTNTDIQYLFEKYKHTTPMTYIRRMREKRDSRKNI
jgi:transcriptional regulator GlxA family with amidase domain